MTFVAHVPARKKFDPRDIEARIAAVEKAMQRVEAALKSVQDTVKAIGPAAWRD